MEDLSLRYSAIATPDAWPSPDDVSLDVGAPITALVPTPEGLAVVTERGVTHLWARDLPTPARPCFGWRVRVKYALIRALERWL